MTDKPPRDFASQITRELWRLSEIDPPSSPRDGMTFWVQTGSHWREGVGYEVERVGQDSFTVRSGQRERSHALADWRNWLAQRQREGRLSLDGHPIRRQAQSSDEVED